MNILTFDIEEWFHILDNDSTKTESEWSNYERRLDANMDRIFSVLEQRQLTATFFCLGWVAREYPHVIKNIVKAGHEVATHSDQHQLAYMQTPAEFREDLKRSIHSLEELTSEKIRSYRAPGFSIKKENKWAFDALIEEGIELDCSVFPAARAHGGFAEFGQQTPSLIKMDSGTLKAFPINTKEILGRHIIFSGGGYFRLIPYPLIRAFAQSSQYIMTYFHPRDFDADQPVIRELSRFRKFKSYYGLKGAQHKLERLLDDFDFISLAKADQLIDWNDVPVIDL
ncbi:MAG: DUF3473 domain-containing protein [Gammaproteobacteria bacterium]|nr:DUF3473 domain-containing protein [Gammaproteobacteria bacterium]